MKKLLSTIILLVFSYTITFAQETEKITPRKLSFSPYVSYNRTDMRGDYAFSDKTPGGFDNKKTAYVETIGGGLDVNYIIKGRFGVNTGVFITQYQSYQVVDIASTIPSDIIDYYGRRRKYTFLHIPLQATYTQPIAKKVNLKLMMGSYLGYFLDRGNIGEGFYGDKTDAALVNSYNSLHVGVLGDARFSFELGKHIDFWLGLRYNRTFNDIKHPTKITYLDRNNNPHDLNIADVFNFTPSALGFLVGITIK
jgi:hypothetical protein